MFKGFFIIGFILFSFVPTPQIEKSFIGKWKVVSANNGVIYDYKKGNKTVTEKFRKSLIGKVDSAETVDKYSSFAGQYNDYYFVFDTIGVFKEIDNDNIRLEGFYEINKEEKKIKVTIGKEIKKKIIEARYGFTNDGLHIFVKSLFIKDSTDLVVEKIEK